MLDRNIEGILDALSVAVFVVEVNQTVIFRNAASVSLFGTGIRGRKLSHFVPNNLQHIRKKDIMRHRDK